MSDNEIKREQPSFEARAESLKKRTKEFFSTYENPNGSEDRLEICLIREGYRAVLMAEEKINRQKAEVERLQKENNQFAEISKMYSEIKAEAVKEFAERLKEHREIVGYDRDFELDIYGSHIRIAIDEFDNLVKEMVGEN